MGAFTGVEQGALGAGASGRKYSNTDIIGEKMWDYEQNCSQTGSVVEGGEGGEEI